MSGTDLKYVNTVDLNQRIGRFRVARRNDGRFELLLDGMCLAITCKATADFVDINSDWYMYGSTMKAREGIAKVQAYIREMYAPKYNSKELEYTIDHVSVHTDFHISARCVTVKATGALGGLTVNLGDYPECRTPGDLLGKRIKVTIEDSRCAGPDDALSSGHEQSSPDSINGLIVPSVRLQR